MKVTLSVALMILGLSSVAMGGVQGDNNPAIRQHRPGKKHLPTKKITSNGKGTQNGNTNSGSNGESGSMSFRPLLGDDAPAFGGPGGDSGNHPGGGPPGGNPPGDKPHDNPPDDPPTWGGPIGGDTPPGNHGVPEIDPASGMSALTLLSGALLVMRGRRKTS